ncbi:MAG: YciI family protein [Steroidobacteraceae bacterium]
MLYAIFCYQAEGEVCAMSNEQDAAMMAELAVAKQQAGAKVKFGPTARLMPTTAAVTVREGRELIVMDGPFAETKEQLLGFYVLEAASLQAAIDAACTLAGPRVAVGLQGALEVRPIHYFDLGPAM